MEYSDTFRSTYALPEELHGVFRHLPFHLRLTRRASWSIPTPSISLTPYQKSFMVCIETPSISLTPYQKSFMVYTNTFHFTYALTEELYGVYRNTFHVTYALPEELHEVYQHLSFHLRLRRTAKSVSST